MENVIGIASGICIGLTVFFTLGSIVLIVVSKIRYRKHIQELGDAWLDAVQTGPQPVPKTDREGV